MANHPPKGRPGGRQGHGYQRPANLFVSTFIGRSNIMNGKLVVENSKTFVVTASGYKAEMTNVLPEYQQDQDIIFSVRPEEFLLNRDLNAEGITATVDEIDDTNPIYGKTVVFTGALSSMGRKEALQIVANLGGIPADSITAKTNYLVIGAADFVKSVKDGKTTKMKKAEALRLKGADIATISETAFFDLIADYQ